MYLLSAALVLVLLLLLVLGWFYKWIANCIKVAQTYAALPCPPRKLPIVGNLLDLPMDAFRKRERADASVGHFGSRIEFTKKFDEFYEVAKTHDFYCIWLGLYPLIAFFHPEGLEVRCWSGDELLSFPICSTSSPARRTSLNHRITSTFSHGCVPVSSPGRSP